MCTYFRPCGPCSQSASDAPPLPYWEKRAPRASSGGSGPAPYHGELAIGERVSVAGDSSYLLTSGSGFEMPQPAKEGVLIVAVGLRGEAAVFQTTSPRALVIFGSSPNSFATGDAHLAPGRVWRVYDFPMPRFSRQNKRLCQRWQLHYPQKTCKQTHSYSSIIIPMARSVTMSAEIKLRSRVLNRRLTL